MTWKRFEHSEETQAWAALYALGSLGGEEKVLFEQHLHEGCPLCEQEMQGLAHVVEGISVSTPPAEPSGRVRERLMETVAAEAKKAAPEKKPAFPISGVLLQQPGLLIARSTDMPWEHVAPGLSRKLLFVDPERRYNTSLIRAEAGARYPSHRHADVEEILVLEGELHLHGVIMRPGDYCRAEPDSIHEETFTETGCLLLQLTSALDQIQV